MQQSNKLLLFLLVFTVLTIGLVSFVFKKTKQSFVPHPAVPSTASLSSEMQFLPHGYPTYTPKKFNIAGKIPGLSAKQIEEHETLYHGYVTQRNRITADLITVDRTGLNRTYSPFRELKVEETYAHNGHLLHELYFENMIDTVTHPGPQMIKFFEKYYGSFENFKKDFFDCAQVSRGWVVTAYCIDDGSIRNFVLEEHNTHVPMLVIPLLVLDVYEHAYMIDYGIKRNPYLEVFWDHINWNVVEQRIDRWVDKLVS